MNSVCASASPVQDNTGNAGRSAVSGAASAIFWLLCAWLAVPVPDIRTPLLLFLGPLLPVAHSLDNGASPLPYLGWSSWNAFGDLSTHKPPIGADALLEIADKLVSSGLRDAGYINFNVDAGWAHDGHFMGRGSNGTLEPSPSLFPKGMKAFCDEIHKRWVNARASSGTDVD